MNGTITQTAANRLARQGVASDPGRRANLLASGSDCHLAAQAIVAYLVVLHPRKAFKKPAR